LRESYGLDFRVVHSGRFLPGLMRMLSWTRTPIYLSLLSAGGARGGLFQALSRKILFLPSGNLANPFTILRSPLASEPASPAESAPLRFFLKLLSRRFLWSLRVTCLTRTPIPGAGLAALTSGYKKSGIVYPPFSAILHCLHLAPLYRMPPFGQVFYLSSSGNSRAGA